MGDFLPLVDLGTESRVKQLALGSSYACALLIDDDMKCVGNGSSGLLAIGSALNIGDIANEMRSYLPFAILVSPTISPTKNPAKTPTTTPSSVPTTSLTHSPTYNPSKVPLMHQLIHQINHQLTQQQLIHQWL